MKRTLVVGVDGSPQSRAAADWAAQEAVRRDLPLHVVHAWPWAPLAAPIVQDRDTGAHRADDLLKEVEGELTHRHPGLALIAEVLSDAPVPAACPVAVVPHP
ncbi:universal stress protein [Streptomyces sp. NPDC059355]|uniref:universal stress protein n=1 Tax=Streptomyces sp. NPDC059355 TaxID=3346811 RepID=UPI003680CDCF